MKRVTRSLAILLCLASVIQCKPNGGDLATSQGRTKFERMQIGETKSAIDNNSVMVQNFLDRLQTEHLDFTTEYQNLLTAIKQYQNTSSFQNPQGDQQKSVNILATMLSSLSNSDAKQDLQSQILNHSFAQWDVAFANIGPYENEAQRFLEEAAVLVEHNKSMSVPPTIPSTAAQSVLASAQTSGDGTSTGSQTATEKGTSLSKNYLLASGLFVFVLAGIGATYSLVRGVQIVKAGADDYIKNFARNFFEDHVLFLKTAFLIYTSIMIYKSYNDNNGNINPVYLKDPSLVIGIIASLTAIYWTFEVAMNAAGKAGRTGRMQGQEPSKEAYYKLKVYESVTSNKGNEWEKLGGTKTEQYLKSVGIISLSSIVAAGSLYTFSQVALAGGTASPQSGQSPDQVFLAAVMRFYAVCQILSLNGVLTLN